MKKRETVSKPPLLRTGRNDGTHSEGEEVELGSREESMETVKEEGSHSANYKTVEHRLVGRVCEEFFRSYESELDTERREEVRRREG